MLFPRKLTEEGAGGRSSSSMKQRLRGPPGFWLDVYVACTLLFFIVTDS